MSRTILTNKKKDFYNFKNKVDLTNRETFGYFSDVNPLNNELFVYLNDSLGVGDGFKSESITNYNLGYDILDTVKLLWDDKINPSNVRKFYDTSIFGTGDKDLAQPELTEYFEYKGNVFEIYQRLTQFTKARVIEEQKVKTKYVDWFDPDFLKHNGLKRVSKYIFHPNTHANKDVNTQMFLNSGDLSYKFNEYFRTKTKVSLASTQTIPEKEMFALANSNSIRPSRIYYKRVETATATNEFENKFIFPLYLVDGAVSSNISKVMGLSVLRNFDITNLDDMKQSK